MEVCEEEELRGMGAAQSQFVKLNQIEAADMKRMEEQEQEQLERHLENKKQALIKR